MEKLADYLKKKKKFSSLNDALVTRYSARDREIR